MQYQNKEMRFVSLWWLFLLSSSAISVASALYCPPYPCDTARVCTVDVSTCQYGTVRDFCDCCDICGKGPGERCSEILYGLCGDGLECVINATRLRPSNQPQQDVSGICMNITNVTEATTEEAPESQTTASTTVETTTTAETVPTVEATATPRIVECRPPNNGTAGGESAEEESDDGTVCEEQCSVTFCSQQRNRICSAKGTQHTRVASRGKCQHTSCRACYLMTEPQCQHLACSEPPTKKCLYTYHTCIRRSPLLLALDSREAQTYAQTHSKSKVICYVPEVIVSSA